MMKSNFSRIMAVVFGALASAANIQVSAQTPSTLSDEFKSGNLKLEYSVFGRGASGADDLKRMYDNKSWEELVKGVVSKRFVVNTYYFYLGAAAEGLGLPAAAYKYYELAAKTPEKCVDYQVLSDSCVGFKFPDDPVRRMSGLAGAIGVEESWLPGKGPLVSDLVGLVPTPMENLLDAKPERSTTRDKFETEEEYKARLEKIKKGFLAVAPLDTRNNSNCETSYDHEAGEYKISRCLALVGGVALRHRYRDGDPIRLANAIGSRVIKRIVSEDYFYAGSHVWSQVIKVSRDEAKALDDDLMVGIVSPDFMLLRKCLGCDSRRSNDAYVTGSVTDYWTIRVRPSNVERIVVYRRSDSRALYSFMPKN